MMVGFKAKGSWLSICVERKTYFDLKHFTADAKPPLVLSLLNAPEIH